MLPAVIGILFLSFNLRAPITAVGSIIELIQHDYGLSNAMAGFITTLPLLAFALVSPFVAWFSERLGHARMMLGGLVLILIGEGVRSYTGVTGLYLGTAVMGVGIAIGNVVIPALIKLKFADRVGPVTSVYTSGMCIFAAVGAGISVPLAEGLHLGWQHALAAWFVLTLATVAIWMPQVLPNPHHAGRPRNTHRSVSIWKSGLAWWVTLFMGTQSLIFYSLVAWLPTIVIAKGMSDTFAGNMALLFQLMAIPSTLVFPVMCGKFRDQKPLVAAVCVLYALGMLGFLLSASPVLLTLSVIGMSVGMGGSISLSIAFISMRSPSPVRAAELSGMSQSAGYLFAALGPVITGFLFDLTGGWTVPLLVFLAMIGFLFVCGMPAGSDRTVHR